MNKKHEKEVEAMLYTKITVPHAPAARQGAYIHCDADVCAPSPAVREAAPKSEAGPSAIVRPQPARGHRRFRLGLPIRLLTAAVFGFIAFLAGCALGDKELCRVLVTLSAASGGKLTYAVPQAGQTVYAQYRDEQHPPTDVTSSLPADAAVAVETSDVYISPAPEADTPTAAEVTDPVFADGEALYPIAARDFSAASVYDIGNQTSLQPDAASLLTHTPKALANVSVGGDEPLVLIVHTHGTECYNEEGYTEYYRASAPVRDEDVTKNVVSMGTELEEVLTAFGIPVLHDMRMCDKESFVKAYNVSYEEVSRLLAEHPSIRFVIDLHRDAIEGDNGLRYKPVFDNAGEKTAQLMFVVGTNAAGSAHPDWQENLSLALHIQNAAVERFPGLMRHINLRQASFNQQLSPGYMLLECGACSNTHEEAKRAIRLFGEALAQVIYAHAE